MSESSADDMKNEFQNRINQNKLRESSFSLLDNLYDAQRKTLSEAQERLQARESWRPEHPENPVEKSPHYQTNELNEKYVKYHDDELRNLESGGLAKRPVHPRIRNRCDYHLEDVIQTIFDRKFPVYSVFKSYLSCVMSKPGKEPPRLRKEVWRW